MKKKLFYVKFTGIFKRRFFMFKKKKMNKKKANNKVINFFWLLVIVLVFTLWLFSINFAKQLNLFTEKDGTLTEINTIDKEEDSDNINILLLGRWWARNDAPDLTDSIILASINKKTKIISMFSIPRDLYVEYYNWDKWKINYIYSKFKSKSWNVDFWVDALKHNIKLITWKDVDYYVNIDFEGFVKFIDSIGWVKVTLEKNFVDNKFPDNNWWYRTFIIRKWTWNLTWEVALNYARSRHSTSDFDRSLRQQEILMSVKNKLLEWWFFSKVSKIKDFYNIFIDYVHTNIWINDALKIFTEIKNNDYEIISSNLNDSCFEWDPFCSKWWFLYVPDREFFGWASVLLASWTNVNNLSNYKNIEKYISLVFDRAELYKENLNISVLNSTRTALLAWDLWFLLRKYWLNIPKNNNSISTLREKVFENSVINYNRSYEESETIKFLRENLIWFEFIPKDELEYSLDNDAKIEIIIWENYNELLLGIKNKLK